MLVCSVHLLIRMGPTWTDQWIPKPSRMFQNQGWMKCFVKQSKNQASSKTAQSQMLHRFDTWDDLHPLHQRKRKTRPNSAQHELMLSHFVAECWTTASFIDPNDVIATSTLVATISSWRTGNPPLRSGLFAMVPLQTHGGQSAEICFCAFVCLVNL